MIKTLKTNIIMVAMVMAFGSAVASTIAHNIRATEKWALVDDEWINVNDLQESDEQTERDYRCDPGGPICTAEFDEDVDPNDDDSSITNITQGSFELE